MCINYRKGSLGKTYSVRLLMELRYNGKLSGVIIWLCLMHSGNSYLFPYSFENLTQFYDTAQSQKRKNVLLVVVDDLRPFLGIYRDPLARTLNIDRLGTRSTVFTKAYAQQSTCAPSRVSMLTSRTPDNTRTFDFKTYFRNVTNDLKTLPQHLKANGYEAVTFGKIFQHGNASGGDDDRVSWSRDSYQIGRASCRERVSIAV